MEFPFRLDDGAELLHQGHHGAALIGGERRRRDPPIANRQRLIGRDDGDDGLRPAGFAGVPQDQSDLSRRHGEHAAGEERTARGPDRRSGHPGGPVRSPGGQLAGQYRSAPGHAGIRIPKDGPHAQALGDGARHLGHARGSSHQDRLVRGPHPTDGSSGEDPARHLHGLVQQVGGDALELLPGDRHRGPMPAPAQVHIRLPAARQGDLRLLRMRAEPLQEFVVILRPGVGRDGNPFLQDQVAEALVPVETAQTAVAVDRDDARRSSAALLDDGDVEGAAAQVVDQAGVPLLQGADGRQGGRGRLRQQSQAVDPGDAGGAAGGLPFGGPEVRRDRDDGAHPPAAQFRLGQVGQVAQNDPGDPLRAVLLVAEGHGGVLAHLPFDPHDGGIRIHRGHEGRSRPHLPPFPVEVDDRGRVRAPVLGTDDDRRAVARVMGDHAAGGSQVDTDNDVHGGIPINSPHRIRG